MNAILYSFINHKKINGTLFYCFEYFIYLKKFNTDVKFIIFDASEEDLEFIKYVFTDKYNFQKEYLSDLIIIKKYSDLFKLKLKNVLIFDVRTFDKLNNFLPNTNKLVYSNEKPTSNNFKNTTFYGFYDYQLKDKVTRLKFFKKIHKVFKNKGDKIFISSLSADLEKVTKYLKIDKSLVFFKMPSQHNENLFANINKIIYWHSGQLDKNNRIVVESFIHNIELEILFNSNLNDSVYERYECIKNGNINELFLDDSDIIITDFLKGIND
jgi:hypothetical protein